jgi:hypothetical protein
MDDGACSHIVLEPSECAPLGSRYARDGREAGSCTSQFAPLSSRYDAVGSLIAAEPTERDRDSSR